MKSDRRNRWAYNVLVAVVSITMLLPFVSIDTYAASVKRPGRCVFSSCSVSGKEITVKWKAIKNAKQYQVAIRTKVKSWIYVKKVKKTSANFKKYNVAGVYRTRSSHNKYKVFRCKKVFKYKIVRKKMTSRTYTYKATKCNMSYSIAVRGVNYKGKTKKSGPWHAKSMRTASKDAPHRHKWVETSRKIKDGYACNGCSRDITKWTDKYDCCGGYHTHQWFLRPEYYTCSICGIRKHKHKWYYTKPTYRTGTNEIITEGYWVCYLCGNESKDGKTMALLDVSDKGFKCGACYKWRTPYDFVADSHNHWVLVNEYWEKKENVPTLDFIHIEGDRALCPGDRGKYTTVFTPASAVEKVKWKSSNPSVVSVDKNGNYKALAVGTAKITATSTTAHENHVFVRVTNPNIGVVKNAVLLINGESNLDSGIVLDEGKKYEVTLKTNPSRAVYEVNFKIEMKSPEVIYQTDFTGNGNLSIDSWENHLTFAEPKMEIKAYKAGTTTIVATITDANNNTIRLEQRVRVQ